MTVFARGQTCATHHFLGRYRSTDSPASFSILEKLERLTKEIKLHSFKSQCRYKKIQHIYLPFLSSKKEYLTFEFTKWPTSQQGKFRVSFRLRFIIDMCTSINILPIGMFKRKGSEVLFMEKNILQTDKISQKAAINFKPLIIQFESNAIRNSRRNQFPCREI